MFRFHNLRRTILSLTAFAAIAVPLMASADTLDKEIAVPELTLTRGEYFELDVVQNGTEFFFEGPVNEAGFPAKGTPFVTTGFIYPAGTLKAYGYNSGITSEGKPAFPELVLGTWTCRGWHLQDGDALTGPVVVTSQTFDFNAGRPSQHMLTTDGSELADFHVQFARPITGGTGNFAGARGEMRQTYVDFNESGGFNMSFEIKTR